MNFVDLYKQIKDIDDGKEVIAECGPMGLGGMMPQQDSVSMNVSMNASGAGGIKDLMAILRNLEHPTHEPTNPHPHDASALFGAEGEAEVEMPLGDDYGNSLDGASGQETFDIDTVTPTGDDMHSKGLERPKVNGGGNPMQETLVSRLAEHYQEIKGR